MIDINNLLIRECQRCKAATVDIPAETKIDDIPSGILLKKHVCIDELTQSLKDFSISMPRNLKWRFIH